MIKKVLGCGGVISMLALAACGGSIQDIGDAKAGGGNGGNGGSSGAAQQHGGSSGSGTTPTQLAGSSSAGAAPNGHGGSTWSSGPCDPPCTEGFGCYPVANDPGGFCAPLCDTQEQGQNADADLSCSNSVRGGAGQCVFSQGYGWPVPGGILAPSTGNVVTGLCSNTCDPLAQDCPAGYTCDHTETYSAFNQQGLYACIPNKDPRALGDGCDRTGDGQCGPGLTCSLSDENDREMHCASFCDMRDPSSCPTNRTCTEDAITLQDNDPNIGVCL